MKSGRVRTAHRLFNERGVLKQMVRGTHATDLSGKKNVSSTMTFTAPDVGLRHELQA